MKSFFRILENTYEFERYFQFRYTTPNSLSDFWETIGVFSGETVLSILGFSDKQSKIELQQLSDRLVAELAQNEGVQRLIQF